MKQLPRYNKKQIVKKPNTPVLLMLISYATVSAVLFGPGIPAIRDFFGISDLLIQFTVVVFLLAYAIGQLFYAPFANRFGRKKTIYAGMFIGVLGALVCALSGETGSFGLFLAGRLLAAVGSGVGLALTFTIINDYYYHEQSIKIIAWAAIAFAIAPGMSATVGGLLVTYLGWESCFWFLVLYGVIILALCINLPETSIQSERDVLNLKKILSAYRKTFSHRILISFSVILGSTTAVIYVFATVLPLIVINTLGVRADIYGALNLILSLGLIIGNIVVLRSAKLLGPIKLVKIGMAVFGFGIIVQSLLLFIGIVDIYTIFLPGFIIFFGIALLYSSAAALATSKVIDKAHASAVMSFINIGVAFIATSVMSVFSFNPVIAMSVVSLAFLTVVFIFYTIGKKHLS